MSESKCTIVRKCRYVAFHGGDIRTKQFQKKLNHKPTLTYAIHSNIIIILVIIFIMWLLANK